MRWAASVCLVLAACAPETSEITIHTGRPFVAAIDRGDGWEVLPDQEDVVFEVGGPFAVASVCGDVSYVEVIVYQATAADMADDGGEWTLPCRQDGGEFYDLEIRAAAGTMGSTRVALGWWSEQLIDDLAERVELRAGVSDRLAVEEQGERRFVFERDVDLATPGEWVIDFDRDGRPREMLPVVTNLTPEEAEGRLSTHARVWANGIDVKVFDFDEDPSTVHVLPADVLRPTDLQRVYAYYEWQVWAQELWVSEIAGDSQFAARFPQVIEEVTFTTRGGVAAASYSGDEVWAYRQMIARDGSILGGGVTRAWALYAHPGWVEARGEDNVIAFPDVTTIPGWLPGWELGDQFTTELILATDPDAETISGVKLRGGVSSP